MIARNEVLLQGNQISLTFGTNKVLEDVNLVIRNVVRTGMTQGQVVSLIGRSGCGKTQLLRILAGLNPPTTGEVLIGPENHQVKPGDMGFVTQNYFLFPWRRVGKTLEIAASKNPTFAGKPKVIQEAIKYYSEELEIENHFKKFPAQLSGGQKQRVAIAQQLLNGSKFILMDEPFSGLDTLMIQRVSEIISKVSCLDEYSTTIIVSHDLESAIALSDTIFVLGKQQEDKGASIIKEFDLISRGLAYTKDIKTNPQFHQILNEVKSLL